MFIRFARQYNGLFEPVKKKKQAKKNVKKKARKQSIYKYAAESLNRRLISTGYPNKKRMTGHVTTNGLSKSERLCSKKQIDALFAGGAKAFSLYPFRVVCIVTDNQEKASAAVLISVPKKRFKRAVKRNRIKRQTREAYRLQKHALMQLLEEKKLSIAIAFIYTSNDLFATAKIMAKMKIILAHVSELLE